MTNRYSVASVDNCDFRGDLVCTRHARDVVAALDSDAALSVPIPGEGND